MRGRARFAEVDEGPRDVETAVAEFRAAMVERGEGGHPDLERYVELVVRCHEGQVRRSGAPYATHPLAVATLAARVGLPSEGVAFALVHDLVDTSAGRQALVAECPPSLRRLVQALVDVETDDRALTALPELALQVKALDRLHNARTWRYVPASSRAERALHTLTVVAPVAERVGMHEQARELLSLSRKALEEAALPTTRARPRRSTC